MPRLLTLFLLPITIGAQADLIGTWKQPREIHVRHYTFDTTTIFHHDEYGDFSEYHFTGHYHLSNDSIFLSYDTTYSHGCLTTRYRPADDTLYVINPNTIKVNNSIYLYNIDRSDRTLSADENGVLTFRIKSLGDTFYLEQQSMGGWRIAEKFYAPYGEYVDIGDYKLPLHSGKNTFWIMSGYGNYRIGYLEVQSHDKPVKIDSRRVETNLNFSRPTYYILYDKYGNVMSRGTSDHVDMSQLPEGKYQLSYDNDITTVWKK